MAINGKVVVITGASSGIGRATARLLADHGAMVVLGARREEALATITQDISSAGGKVVYRVTDVTRRADVEALVALAVRQGEKLDVIVNNAGIAPTSRFDALRVEDWDAMIDVNLRGTLYGIAAALPIFQRQQSGHFVNIVSTAGLKIVPTMGVYAATKNAVRTISEALRQESGPNVRVIGASPSFVSTNLAKSTSDAAVREAIERRTSEIAIPPEAIAHGIAFAIDQPEEVDVGSIVIRPTAQD